jgi:hypothetical protein
MCSSNFKIGFLEKLHSNDFKLKKNKEVKFLFSLGLQFTCLEAYIFLCSLPDVF